MSAGPVEGVVVAWAWGSNRNIGAVEGTLSQKDELSDEIPPTARKYLHQAQESLHVRDGAVMLAASAVDAMLKAKESLLADQASDMALWAHHVRLEANNPRHVDEDEPHATPEAARQAVEFAAALANSCSCCRPEWHEA